MALEQFANNATTTLNGAITNVATTLVVTSAALFPTAGYFRVLIDSEILLVTSVSGATFTVTRGTEGTTGAAHATLATVTLILTAASIVTIRPIFKRKNGDESVVSSTVLQNDDDLLFTVNVNELWVVRIVLYVDAVTAGDIKVGLTVPAGTTYRFGVTGLDVAAAAAAGNVYTVAITAASSILGGAGAGTITTIVCSALIRIGGTAGTVQLQWAQGTSSVTATIVKADSHLLADLVV